MTPGTPYGGGRIAQSGFRRVPDAGHMIRQTATRSVMGAIEEGAARRGA